MRTRRPIIRMLLAVVLFVVAFGTLTPATAQQSPSVPTPVSVPLPTASLPMPTRTAPPSPIEMIPGAGDAVSTGTHLWQRFGVLGAVCILVLGAAFFVLSGFAKKAGEGLGEFAYRVMIGRWFDQRIRVLDDQDKQRQKARDAHGTRQSSLVVYFDWLQEALKHLPIIPIRSTERQEQLLLEKVYVPLRVVERIQIEGFRKLLHGDFDLAGEYQVRKEAFESLEGSSGVYRLLSEPGQLNDARTVGAHQPCVRRAVGHNTSAAVERTTRLLLVGDAGSGKTTTLQYGALVLAQDCRAGSTASMREYLDLHAATAPVPFYIRLTLVATYVREAHQRARADELPGLQGAPSTLLLDWLDRYTAEQVTKRGATIASDFPSHRIAGGGCLIMLDGLDETGDMRERDYMQRLIAHLVQDYPNNRYVIASRPFEDLRLPGFVERHLSPLNHDEINQLLQNWFGAVRPSSRHANETVADHVVYLREILDANARLFEMAMNPLLLTSMALLVHTGVGLPRERAELYNRLIYLLLDTWRTQQTTGGVPGRDDRLTRYGGEESASGVQRRLQELAAWMQEHRRREIRLHEAQQILRPVYEELKQWDTERVDDYVAILLESLALESGLIQRRDGGYSFAHYTVQEYLTARAYDQRANGVQALFQNWTKPRWRETILLAVGHWATGGQPEKARQLLQLLLEHPDTSMRVDDMLLANLIGSVSEMPNQIDAVLLVAQALDDADAGRVVELALLRDTTIRRLRDCAFQPQPQSDPVLRDRAATMLDRLDADSGRPGLDLATEDYWAISIEPGTFSMGDDHGAYDDEKPQFDYTIRQPYALARFPVTNRQYLRFVDALAGRGTAEAVAAAHKLLALMQQHEQTPKQFRPRFWPGARFRAGEGNHPVGGVTWYAATAFAWWANETFLTPEQRAAGDVIRLPTEAEWERAAAYPPSLAGSNTRAGRRAYPWGAELTAAVSGSITASIQANTGESQIRGTSVVGIFPHGVAACGAEELSGNVWEWCSTPLVDYPFSGAVSAESMYTMNKRASRKYVLRGGSWGTFRGHARCASRNVNNPDFDYANYGFRLARVFSFPSS